MVWDRGSRMRPRTGETMAWKTPRQREIRRRNERHARRLAVQRWCIAFLYVLDMAVAVTAVVAFAEGAISQSGLARSLLHAIGFAILID